MSNDRLTTVLSEALRGVDDVDGACQATIDTLVACGFELAAIYLERGDRLRCLGVHGYGQIFDGIPPGVGVIGTTFRTGRAAHVVLSRDTQAYRQAVGDVVEEVCLPVTVDGRCVGALNVESQTGLKPDAVPALTRVAEQLSAALERLGGPPPESRSQRLVRFATTLAAASTLTELAQTLLDASMTMSGMSSAALVVGGRPRVLAAAGQAAGALSGLSVQDLELLHPWVDEGGSSRTTGGSGALALPAQRLLADTGLTTFVVVPVKAGAESLGLLLVGDQRAHSIHPDSVESVELLAALAAADFRSLRASSQLRHQARTDHLTGLPHRRAFTEALELALLPTGSPSGRRLAVLLMDLDGFKTINDTHGHQTGDEVLCRTAGALSAALRSTDTLYRLGGDEFAALLFVDRWAEAQVVADRLLEAARTSGTPVSIGGCLVRDGEQPNEVVAAADVQLYAAKRGGRNRLHARE